MFLAVEVIDRLLVGAYLDLLLRLPLLESDELARRRKITSAADIAG